MKFKSSVAVACFLPGRAKDLPAPRYICVSPICLHDMDSGNSHTKYMVWEADVARMEEMAWNTVRIIVNTVIASSSSSY
jgi:hypothetical protein